MYLLRVALLTIIISAKKTICADFKVTEKVYLEIQHGDRYVGKIEIGLFGDIAPKTVLNFKTLAAVGINGSTYEGSIFHRVIERFMIQGGDVITHDGTSSVSIFGGYFEDENFDVKHNSAGFVSMANEGPDTNGCQFFITTIATPWLDGKHTVFGKVVDGQHIVHIIEHVKTDAYDRPLEPVKIIQSGVLPTSPFYVSDDPYDYNIYLWIKAGIVPLSFSFAILLFFQWVLYKLDGFKLTMQ